MPEELLREIRKLEVRLSEFLKEEEKFAEELGRCIEEFRRLNTAIEKYRESPETETVEELIRLRLEATETLDRALRRESEAEHEKSHLLESYGSIVLTTEKEFQSLR